MVNAEDCCPASGKAAPEGATHCPVCNAPLRLENGLVKPHVVAKQKPGLGVVDTAVFQEVMAIMNATTVSLVRLANDLEPRSVNQSFVLIVIQLVRQLAGPKLIQIERQLEGKKKSPIIMP